MNFSSNKRRQMLKAMSGIALLSANPKNIFANINSPSAVVIGAGIAGLSTAYDLIKEGFQVSIFEKESFTGGRMVELQMGPLYQFTHAQAIDQSANEMMSLAHELGILEELLPLRENDPPKHLLDNNPLDNGKGLYFLPSIEDMAFNPQGVRIPGMTSETINNLTLLQPEIEKMRLVDSCQIHTGSEYDNESIGDYFERILGKQVIDDFIPYCIQPYCEWWGWPVYETSIMALMPSLQNSSRIEWPRGGIGALTRKLGSILPVQNNTTVRYVTPPDSKGRHTIHYLDPNLERKTVTPDIVVVATEAKYLDKVVQELTPKQDRLAKNSFHSKEAVVCYILDDKYAPKKMESMSYTVNHPDPIKAKTTVCMATPRVDHLKFPPHVRFALSRSETPKWQNSGDTVEDYCFPLAKHSFPFMKKEHVIDIVNYTCDDLIYIPVGYVKQMKEVLLEQSKKKRGLYFAGEYLAGAHTGAACSSGRELARTIAKHWI